MQQLCVYGCGREGVHKQSNGKWCCSVSNNSCPARKATCGRGVKQWYTTDAGKKHTRQSTGPRAKAPCMHCGKLIPKTVVKHHEKACYLNPAVTRLCPVCNKPIKHKHAITCSCSCSNIYFDHGKVKSRIKGLYGYANICEYFHGFACIICGETIAVHSHHLDKDRTNNDPRNLVPLCPTHHEYMHRYPKGRALIERKIDDYITLFKKKFVLWDRSALTGALISSINDSKYI